MAVALRRDDASILFRYRELTGLGTITAAPARGTSRPQARWSISSGLECARLAEILETFPLRGRKRFEFAPWSQAVRIQERSYPASADLSPFADCFRLARRYVAPHEEESYPVADEPGLLWYLGGFFTGEGSFRLSRREARVCVKLRHDDRPLLRSFAELTGVGRVYDVAPCGVWNPSSVWVIFARGDLPEVIEILSAARLLGRKRREFHVWRVGAEEFIAAHRDGRPRDFSVIDAAMNGLSEIRTYRDFSLPPAEDREGEQREAFVDVLQTFGRLADGPLTCTHYMKLRRQHSHWPNYVTLGRTFGSWPAALAAAGLGKRAHPRSRRAACV
jgi:hypothetical protein